MARGEFTPAEPVAVAFLQGLAAPVEWAIAAASSSGLCALAPRPTQASCGSFTEAWIAAVEIFPELAQAQPADPAEHPRCAAHLAAAKARLASHPAGASDAPAAPPLELRGTPFQRKVWERILEIPRGEVRTYRQIAEAIGCPSAARAVASACASNRIAILIPCHRVIGSGGSLRGYRWGLPLKEELLRHGF